MSVWISSGVVPGSELERLLRKHHATSELAPGFVAEIMGYQFKPESGVGVRMAQMDEEFKRRPRVAPSATPEPWKWPRWNEDAELMFARLRRHIMPAPGEPAGDCTKAAFKEGYGQCAAAVATYLNSTLQDAEDVRGTCCDGRGGADVPPLVGKTNAGLPGEACAADFNACVAAAERLAHPASVATSRPPVMEVTFVARDSTERRLLLRDLARLHEAGRMSREGVAEYAQSVGRGPRIDEPASPPGPFQAGSFAGVIHRFMRCIADPPVTDDSGKWARDGWNGKNQYIFLQLPHSESDATVPYIVLRTADGQFVPWAPSQTDMLARDWYVVK